MQNPDIAIQLSGGQIRKHKTRTSMSEEKQLYRYFRRHTHGNADESTAMWLRIGKEKQSQLKIETTYTSKHPVSQLYEVEDEETVQIKNVD